jgi:hypothetical protein
MSYSRQCGTRYEELTGIKGSSNIQLAAQPNHAQEENITMRIKLQIVAFALSLVFILQVRAQTADPIFPKGDLSTVKNHTGNIWLKELSVGDSTFDPTIAVATYDAGAKLDWHVHPGGQVLLITEGTGYYQETGSRFRSFTRVMSSSVLRA